MGKMTPIEARVSTLKALTAATVLAWSLPSHALTLGKFQSLSGIGEPLRAEVEITQFTPDELRGLRAQLGSVASFRQAGMEYNPALVDLATRIDHRSDGRPFIVLSGRVPVQESFIDLILEAQWPTGRVVKNYALLLNADVRQTSAPLTQRNPSDVITSPATPNRSTPTISPPPSNDGGLKPTSVELNANQVPVYRYESVGSAPTTPAPTATASTPVTVNAVPVVTHPSAPVTSFAGGDALTVRSGDTASNLLAQRLPPNVSLDQMLLALARANPNAFIEGNVNLVRAGTVLRIPTANEATQISRSEARQMVLAQNRDFAAYALRVAQSPLLVTTGQSREMSGSVTNATPSEPVSSNPQDKLTLSKAQAGEGKAEAKLATEREAKDTAEQLQALHQNLQDLEALSKNKKPDADKHPSPALTGAAQPQPSLLDQLSQNKSMWMWVIGALLGLMAMVYWIRNKSAQSQAVFAPSYDDIPSPAEPAAEGTGQIPPQMAGIDLNLNNTSATSAPTVNDATTAPTVNEVTEQNKLALASQLLDTGDKELARTLIMSVASTASGDLKARALQMLGQIA